MLTAKEEESTNEVDLAEGRQVSTLSMRPQQTTFKLTRGAPEASPSKYFWR